MIFPQLGPTYYTEKDRGILDRMSKFYTESITLNQSFWVEAAAINGSIISSIRT